jgi:hypothetical protein
MVDATRGSGAHFVAHFPVLVVDADQVDDGDGCRKPRYFQDGGDNMMARFDLINQDLWVDGAQDDALDFDTGWAYVCPESRDDDSFRWVASAARINAGSGTLIPNGLRENRAPRAVAARFKLTEGCVTTHQWAEDDLRLIVRWIFRNDDGKSQAGFEQAMAEQVRLEYPFDGSHLRIRAVEDIHAEWVTEVDPICLKAQGGVIHAFVANMPDADIEKRDYSSEVAVRVAAVQRVAARAPGVRQDDHHFIHFYDLVTGGPKNRIPRPFDRCPLDPGPAAGNPKCPPVQLAAQEDA